MSSICEATTNCKCVHPFFGIFAALVMWNHFYLVHHLLKIPVTSVKERDKTLNMTFEGLIISWPCFCPAFRHIRQPWDQQNEVTEPGWMMETNLMLFTPAPKGHSNFQQHNQQISEIQFLVELSSRGNSTKMETVSRHERSRPRLNVSYWTFVQRLSLILVPFCHSFDCLCFITMTITIITTALYK